MMLIKKSLLQYVPAWLQQPCRRLFLRPLKGFIRAVTRDIWLPIYRIEQSGLTAILIGHQAYDPYLINLLYAEYLKPIRIGTVPIWSLDRVMRRWQVKADVIIFRDRKFQPRGAIARRMLTIPYLVRQSIDLPPADTDLLAFCQNSSTRRDLKKIRDAEFQYEVTQDPAQLDFFYHQMHQPYIRERHRDSADIFPWESFRQAYGKMELLLIRKSGLPVAGYLNLQTDDCYTLHVLGVLNADRELLSAGAVAASYWFSIVEAHRRGCATVNMQCARPFLKDGVMVYKKKWGSRIVMDHRERELWFLPCGNRLPMYRFLEENPFICERDGRLASMIFLGSHVTLNDRELSSYLKECHYYGDRLSTYVVLLNGEWAARTETIQNILSGLPQPGHILDLSHGSLAELPELISNWQNQFYGSSAELPDWPIHDDHYEVDPKRKVNYSIAQ